MDDNETQSHKISDEYLAGFFDGEGSISILPRGKTGVSFVVVVQLGQVNPLILHYCQERWGGSVTKGQNNPRSKVCFKWSVASAKAVAFLKEIGPHLLIKREQADIAIEFFEANQRVHIHKHSPVLEKRAVAYRRRQAHQRMAVLNKRGV